jgi:uncharacterized membrane protein
MNSTTTTPWFLRHWFPLFTSLFGLYVLLPFLAPLLMHLGWEAGGRVIYLIYSLLCHQLAQRSYFLFGPQAAYTLAELQAAGVDTTRLLDLRAFIGNADLGWKVAWSDRMVWMYASVPAFGLLWRPLRARIVPLPWWGFALLLLPMALDGGTHFISDFAGIGQGFRDSNDWLAALTRNAMPAWFYAGDAPGSFNAWMRLITGLLFGLGCVWFGFPHLDRALEPGE